MINATPNGVWLDWAAFAVGGSCFLLARWRVRKWRAKRAGKPIRTVTRVCPMSEGELAELLANFTPVHAKLAAIHHDMTVAGNSVPVQPFVDRTREAIAELERLCRYLSGLNIAFASDSGRNDFNAILAENQARAAALREVVAHWPHYPPS